MCGNNPDRIAAESGEFLLTEDSYFLIVEPVETVFANRFAGVAVIIDKGKFWEMDLGCGSIKSEFADSLALLARNSGATGVKYE